MRKARPRARPRHLGTRRARGQRRTSITSPAAVEHDRDVVAAPVRAANDHARAAPVDAVDIDETFAAGDAGCFTSAEFAARRTAIVVAAAIAGIDLDAAGTDGDALREGGAAARPRLSATRLLGAEGVGTNRHGVFPLLSGARSAAERRAAPRPCIQRLNQQGQVWFPAASAHRAHRRRHSVVGPVDIGRIDVAKPRLDEPKRPEGEVPAATMARAANRKAARAGPRRPGEALHLGGRLIPGRSDEEPADDQEGDPSGGVAELADRLGPATMTGIELRRSVTSPLNALTRRRRRRPSPRGRSVRPAKARRAWPGARPSSPAPVAALRRPRPRG